MTKINRVAYAGPDRLSLGLNAKSSGDCRYRRGVQTVGWQMDLD
jgi:hypothetical protein